MSTPLREDHVEKASEVDLMIPKEQEATPTAVEDSTPDASKSETMFGMPMKYLALAMLVLQNCGNVLVLRYTRTLPGTMFLSSTAVLMQETLKIPISFMLLAMEKGGMAEAAATVRKEFIGEQPLESAKVLVPAIIYTIQSNLLYIAISNLDAPTFQVTYQAKILTTAMVSIPLLGRRFDLRQWCAMGFLMLGVILVQMPSGSRRRLEGLGEVWSGAGVWDSEARPGWWQQDLGARSLAETAETAAEQGQNKFVGLGAAIIACFSSGFAGVYLEKVLKESKQSVWMRNIQLATFSLIPASLGVSKDWEAVSELGFFSGYHFSTWCAIFLGSGGGLLVALVVKHADNVLKGFATSLSIVLSSVLSVFIFNFVPSTMFGVGSIVVVMATAAYQTPASKLKEWWMRLLISLSGAMHLAAGTVDPGAGATAPGGAGSVNAT